MTSTSPRPDIHLPTPSILLVALESNLSNSAGPNRNSTAQAGRLNGFELLISDLRGKPKRLASSFSFFSNVGIAGARDYEQIVNSIKRLVPEYIGDRIITSEQAGIE